MSPHLDYRTSSAVAEALLASSLQGHIRRMRHRLSALQGTGKRCHLSVSLRNGATALELALPAISKELQRHLYLILGNFVVGKGPWNEQRNAPVAELSSCRFELAAGSG